MKGELTNKEKKFLTTLNEKAVELGFGDFDTYFSNRLSYSLGEIAKELNISYNALTLFCRAYYRHKREVETAYSIEDFKRLFGEDDEPRPSGKKGRRNGHGD